MLKLFILLHIFVKYLQIVRKMSGIDAAKKELRKDIRLKKAKFLGTDAQIHEQYSIWQRVESLDIFKTADSVFLYCSMPDEVDTAAFMAKWEKKKKLYVPLVIGENIVIKEYHKDKLRSGYKGILEPEADLPDISPETPSLALIPGMAFDKSHMRLGRGGGFYDRLMPQLKCPKLGIAFSFQLIDNIQGEPWDCKVDMVVTPDEII